MGLKILRIRDVQRVTGLSCSTIYRKMAAGEFPHPVMLAKRTVGWRENDVDTWIESLAAAQIPEQSAA